MDLECLLAIIVAVLPPAAFAVGYARDARLWKRRYVKMVEAYERMAELHIEELRERRLSVERIREISGSEN